MTGSTTIDVIILAVAAIGALLIIAWRAPDRSPGADQRAQREREE